MGESRNCSAVVTNDAADGSTARATATATAARRRAVPRASTLATAKTAVNAPSTHTGVANRSWPIQSVASTEYPVSASPSGASSATRPEPSREPRASTMPTDIAATRTANAPAYCTTSPTRTNCSSSGVACPFAAAGSASHLPNSSRRHVTYAPNGTRNAAEDNATARTAWSSPVRRKRTSATSG